MEKYVQIEKYSQTDIVRGMPRIAMQVVVGENMNEWGRTKWIRHVFERSYLSQSGSGILVLFRVVSTVAPKAT